MWTDAAIQSEFPKTWSLFAEWPDGHAHLRRMAQLDGEWAACVRGEQAWGARGPSLNPALGEADDCAFDVIYAGGTLSLPHAVLMARRGWRVLVFDRWKVGTVRREWNIGRAEFDALHESGLFTPEEAEPLALRRYKTGLVQWHEGSPKWVDGVLDVPLDAEGLMRKTREALVHAGGDVRDGWTLRGYRPGRERVTLEIETPTGVKTLGARLLILATGSSAGRDFDLICPTVGTVGCGYAPGDGGVDPDIGELLVTTEHAQDGRQLIWELFPGRADEVATYLFYYHEPYAAMPGALLELFERYLEKLPGYKAGLGPDAAVDRAHGVTRDGITHLRPVYGLIPAYTRPLGRSVSPCDRVLAYGDAAAQQSPLIFTGFGSALRHLTRMVDLVERALREDTLDQAHLDHVRAGQENTHMVGRLTLMMTVREGRTLPNPAAINGLLDAAFDALWDQGDAAIQAFIQDRFTFAQLHRFMLGTMERYPGIFSQVFATLTADEVVRFVTDYLRFAVLSGLDQAAGAWADSLMPRAGGQTRAMLERLRRVHG